MRDFVTRRHHASRAAVALTEIEQAEQAVEDAKRDLADAESYLEFLKDNPPVQSREA